MVYVTVAILSYGYLVTWRFCIWRFCNMAVLYVAVLYPHRIGDIFSLYILYVYTIYVYVYIYISGLLKVREPGNRVPSHLAKVAARNH